MEKGLYYLAVPYQGTDEEQQYRVAISLKAVTAFLHQGLHVFAPLLYVNTIADALGFTSLEKRRAIVMPYLFDFLRVSKGLILIELEGWQRSWGIHEELIYCIETHLPVYRMKADEIGQDLSHAFSTPWDPQRVKDLMVLK